VFSANSSSTCVDCTAGTMALNGSATCSQCAPGCVRHQACVARRHGRVCCCPTVLTHCNGLVPDPPSTRL
jgi:hypothetical protein